MASKNVLSLHLHEIRRKSFVSELAFWFEFNSLLHQLDAFVASTQLDRNNTEMHPAQCVLGLKLDEFLEILLCIVEFLLFRAKLKNKDNVVTDAGAS